MNSQKKIYKVFHIFVSVVLTVTLIISTVLLPPEFAGASTYKKSDSSRVTLLLGGDLMCQYKQQSAAYTGKTYSFHYAFDYVREIISSADFAIANLETNISSSSPLSCEQKEKYGKPYLNAPASYLSALKSAGFDVLVAANNHNADTGVKGLKETVSSIDKQGFKRTGIYKNKNEKRFLILNKNGIKIGIASYATYFNKSIRDFSKANRLAYLNSYSETKVQKDIRNMKKQGAEYIIIYFHSGNEYTNVPGSKQMRIAREIADSGADYILCSHSHTVQPYDIITAKSGKKVPVAYGLGNFISHMATKRSTTYGMMISLTLVKTNGKVRLKEEGYYPLRLLPYNQETGSKYQLLPATDKTIKSIENKTVINKLKVARKEISEIVGNDIEQY